MPAYNVDRYIKDAIQSILDQNFSDWELIVVNDGSTDNTWEVISTFNDSRIQSFNFNKNRGVGWASKYALERINSPYIARMDSDDLCMPDRLKKQYEFMEQNSDIAVVRCYAEIFSDDPEVKNSRFYKRKKSFTEPRCNQEMTSEKLSETLYWYLCLINPTTFMRTDVVKNIGYQACLKISEDYHLLYNINRQGYKFDTVPEVLYRYRVVRNSATETHNKINRENIFYYVKHIDILNLCKKTQVVIWGTGSQAKDLLELLEQDNIKISGFIDYNQDLWGSKIDDIPVYSPDILKPDKYKVLIAAEPVLEKVISYLYNKGYKNTADFMTFI